MSTPAATIRRGRDGVVEAGEAPRNAAARECLEELGLSVAVGRLLAIGHRIARANGGDAMAFVYDGGVLDEVSDVRLQEEELASWCFVHLEEARRLLGAEKGARVAAALTALADGSVVELTHSSPT
jgi:ADP-ribose pyrophosphatase YjhB (NUDIX family)